MSGAANDGTPAGGDLRIRRLRPEDRAEWGALWQAYLAFYDTELPAAVHDTTFARLLDAAPDGPQGFVAARDGRAVGLVHYLFHAHCWRPEGICYLQDLYAAPEARGTGVGRALIEAVYAAADARGVPGVYWLTQDFNATARRLYDRIGVATPFIRYVRGTG
ncbi:MAG: GNAT family N-acetyltransferase [Rhodobacteraceae bacterium]|nr:GNAT family N-acetyltransferase [Paracoccaceae bacterium]